MLSLAKFIKKEIELRENLVGTGFLDPPPLVKTEDEVTGEQVLSSDYRCTLLGEIVETVGFTAENTYIFYDTFLPEGWAFEESNEQEVFGFIRDEHAEFNKRKSVTHTSKATVQLVDDQDHVEGTQYVSHFSFPLDFQLLAQSDKMAERPYLLLQVNSIDSWGRHRVEGYGFVRFPKEPGYHKLEVETWRPRGSLQSEIHSFFLGGSIRIHKLEKIIQTHVIDEQGKHDVINRFGLETENSGKIRVNLNMCLQDAVSRKNERKRVYEGKEALLLETKKQVMQAKLKIKEQQEQDQKDALLNRRAERRANPQTMARGRSGDPNALDYGYAGQQYYSDDDGQDYFENDSGHDYQQSERSYRGRNDQQYQGAFDRRDAGGMQILTNQGLVGRFQY